VPQPNYAPDWKQLFRSPVFLYIGALDVFLILLSVILLVLGSRRKKKPRRAA
jgi:hypothetical protein